MSSFLPARTFHSTKTHQLTTDSRRSVSQTNPVRQAKRQLIEDLEPRLLLDAAAVYRQAQVYSVGSGITAIAAADLNGDGLDDLLITKAAISGNPPSATVLLRNADGTLQPPAGFSIGAAAPTQAAFGDLNGDGKTDVVVVGSGSTPLSILLGNGDGTLQFAINSASIAPASHVAVGDFNGDGKADIAVSEVLSVAVLLGNGDGTFQTKTEYATNFAPTGALAVGDFNHDGYADVLVYGGAVNSVLFGSGDGTFASPITVPGIGEVKAVGDFNGDGNLDLLDNQTVSRIALGNSDGTWQTPRQVTSLTGSSLFAVGDFNGDALSDVVTSMTANTVSIVPAQQDGSLGVLTAYGTGAAVDALAVMRTGNGTVDVATLSKSAGTISILRGNGAGSLESRIEYTVDYSFAAGNMVTGDFTGDGQDDIAVSFVSYVNWDSFPPFTGSAVALLSKVGSTNVEHTLPLSGNGPTAMVAGDFNGDGELDLALAFGGSNSGSGTRVFDNRIGICLSNGDGTFSAPAYINVGSGPSGLAAFDSNGDGNIDLAVANSQDNALSILRGNGDGTFQPAITYDTASGPGSVAVGDFNADGQSDIAVGCDSSVTLLVANGDGTYRQGSDIAGVQGRTAVGDFNGDGRCDLVTTDYYNNVVDVVLGNGDGTFGPTRQYATGNQPSSIAVCDVNGDGISDLVVTNSGNNPDGSHSTTISLLAGVGDGSFSPQSLLETSPMPGIVAVGDFNADSRPDLAVGNYMDGTLDAWLNAATPAAPVGAVDASSLSSISGWAYDADVGDAAVQVRVDIDGHTGTPFAANGARGDVTMRLGSADHGFDFALPQLAPGTHTIDVYAIDQPSGAAVLIGSQTVGRADMPTRGSLDVVNVNGIMGWAFDADSGNNGADAIQVRVDIDGQTGTPVTADRTRGDLQSVLGSSAHGFDVPMPQLGLGTHTIQVYALGMPAAPALIGARTFVNKAPTGSVDVANISTIAGWAFDPEVGSGAVQVRIDIDGQTGTPFDAKLTRGDLQSYVGSMNHGYNIALPALAVGQHSVQVYAIDSPSGQAVLLGSRTVTRNDTPAIGWLDSVTSTHISGWAYDADSGNGGADAIQVRVDIDGVAGTPVNADHARADLVSHFGSPNHGFTVNLPALAVGTHTVRVYALGAPDGTAVQIGPTQTIVNQAPLGSIDVANNSAVMGWAFDPDAGANAVQVRVDVDGQTGTPLTAHINRPDLQSYFGSTAHGYSFDVSHLSFGTHTIQVYVLDSQTQAATLLGTRTITRTDTPATGSVDVFNAAAGIEGWAYDAEAGASAIQVRVDIDGIAGTPVTADLARGDLQSYLGSMNHGYSVPLPQVAPGTHTIKVFALGAPDGTPVQIGTTRTLMNQGPIGSADAVIGGKLYGWAYDADAGTSTVQVRVDVDGVTGTPVTANLTRTELQAYIGSTQHGYAVTLPTLAAGTHTLQMYVLDDPTGQAVLVATKVVTV